MGSMLSTTKDNDNHNVAGRVRATSPSKEGSLFGMGTLVGEMDGLRFAELMHALQKIARLQREATSARIDARQKRREAAFKRQEVWIWDAKFMGEVQRLSAEGKLAGLGELLKLAAKCQSARDDLGPLEQEGTEAEQHWEGQIYTLRQTEERLYNEFNREFAIAEAYPPGPSSDDSSQYRSSSGQKSEGSDDIATPLGRMIIPYRIGSAGSITSSSSLQLRPLPEDLPDRDSELNRQGPFLAGLEGIGAEIETWNYSGGSDSGLGDINDPLDGLPEADLRGPSQPLPKRNYSSIELYPHLLIEFTSKRDRINKWLEGIILESHLEATSLYGIVKTQLAAENKTIPSNWSQLVIAYWQLDGAANTHFGQESLDLVKNITELHEIEMPGVSSQEDRNQQEERPMERHQHPAVSNTVEIPKKDVSQDKGTPEPMISPRSMRSGSLVPPSPPQSHANSETGRFEKGKESDPR
ncbi:hypothetical protein ACEPPN_010316 [Leptodophora sp. 'Broadleaf-Isolate-01']